MSTSFWLDEDSLVNILSSDAASRPGLAWSWESAGLGTAYALPAAVVAANDPRLGMAVAVGVLPAAIVGLAPRRRGRLALILVGALTGLPMVVGGVLASAPVLAVAAIWGLAVGAAALATRSPVGQIAMVLSLPMIGVGLSYSDVGTAAGLAGLIVLGSLYACLVSMLWPEQSGRANAGPWPPCRPSPMGFGSGRRERGRAAGT